MPATYAEAKLALEPFRMPEPKVAVLVGGTLGMGGAVARRLASLGCGRIIVLGRNEARGHAMVETLKTLATRPGSSSEYIKADVGTAAGMHAAAKAIEEAVGPRGIDYLIMTQGGVPTAKGAVVEDKAAVELAFNVQGVSRFALAYLLTEHGCLADGASVMSIANSGQTLADLDPSDLYLESRYKAQRGKVGFFFDQSKRDSCVIDAFTEECNARYPKYRYFSLWPGLVTSEEFSTDFCPFPIDWLMWAASYIIGRTPDEFSIVPLYILLAPEGAEKVGPSKYWAYNLKATKPGAWASNLTNRKEMWETLKQIIGEK